MRKLGFGWGEYRVGMQNAERRAPPDKARNVPRVFPHNSRDAKTAEDPSYGDFGRRDAGATVA